MLEQMMRPSAPITRATLQSMSNVSPRAAAFRRAPGAREFPDVSGMLSRKR